MKFDREQFVDIHSHLLPGIDDGPGSMEETVAMARAYAETGVKRVVATPHFLPGTAWAATKQKVLALVDAVQNELQAREIELEILPGMEIGYHTKIEQRLERNELLPLGPGDWYLIEPPFHGRQDDLLDGLDSLLAKRYRCILAHPERIKELAENLVALRALVDRGLLIQITAGSLLGSFGNPTREAARNFCEYGCCHFIASDAHTIDKRGPLSKDEWRELMIDPVASSVMTAGNGHLKKLFD